MLLYIPKKSKEIYKEVIAHRGFHLKYPENTLAAYKEASEKNLAIELDVRLTLDGYLICYHDRYTKRLLGIRGKTTRKTFEQLERYKILNSDEKIPTLNEVLSIINGNTTLLIEVKGMFTKRFQKKLMFELSNYYGRLYFHAKNLITYYRLRKIFGDKVFWVLNPFRQRFKFIKNKQYRQMRFDNAT